MAEDEVLMEVIVNECDEVQFYSPADQCKTLYEDKEAMLRTISEAVREGVLVLPTVKWDEIKSVRFTSNIEKSIEVTTQEVIHETEYETYEIVEETPVDETVMSSEVPEEIIIDVGLSSGKQLICSNENESLDNFDIIDERLNLCPFCDYRTYNVGHFKVHMRQHTGEAPFACEYCPYRSKQKSNLKRHLRQHLEGKDNFECEMCSFTCTKEKVFKRHLKLHQRSRPLRPCPFCDYFSSSLAHLTVHIRQHTGETPYHCGVCQYKTVQKSNLTRHLKKHRHHRVSRADKLRVCDHCNYRTPNSAHLLAHIRAAHTGEAPYSCKHCDYKSAQRSNLKRHMRKHTGERPFSCHICNYTTAYGYVLKKHIENHSDKDEKFKCESCDYFTNSSLEYRRHLKMHSGRSVFCCQFCGYISINSEHFKVHLRRHTKEAPYQCHHCDYSSAQRSNLKRHIQTHTENNKDNNGVENNVETQNVIDSETIVLEDESGGVVDDSQALSENGISENVQIIDTTKLDNGDVEIYESEEAFVEASYSPEGEIEEVVDMVPESSMEVVGEEHVVTTQQEGEYEVYEDCNKIYLCSYCSYQSPSSEDIEAHMQEHEGVLTNGVDAVESGISESDKVKGNISFLNKSQTEKLKEFKRLLQEGTANNTHNVIPITKLPQQKVVETEIISSYQQPVQHEAENHVLNEECRATEVIETEQTTQETENVEYRNEPSPEEVTLYGEVETPVYQEEILTDDMSLSSSVIIVGTSENLGHDYKCELCGFKARTIWELKSHIRVHTGEMSYVCPQCPFKTNQRNSFQRHVRHLHGRRGNRPAYQCKLCDFKTKNREILFKHAQSHSKKTPTIECNICEQVMGSVPELKGHMKLHIGEAPYECYYCGKLTARKLHMRRHMKRHICTLEGKGPPYECDSCGYQTVFKANYLRHLESHELDPPKALICHYCRFVTLDNKVFKKHLGDHKNPDRLEMLKDQLKECPFCDYNTYNRGHFKVHLRQHTGLAPFRCHICQYSSAQRSNLKRHIKLNHNRLGELDNPVSETTKGSLNNNDEGETSKHKRKPLREHNNPLETETPEDSSKNDREEHPNTVMNLETLKLNNSVKSKKSGNFANKKRDYIKRAGNVSESEMRIRRRLEFNIRKVPKQPTEGFNVGLCGEILKSKRQLRDFEDYGKIVKKSDINLSTVLEKESHLESMFAPLRESLHALKNLKDSDTNTVTFTIYFKSRDKPDSMDMNDTVTDIEAELLTDSNDSDSDSIKLDEELSPPTIVLESNKNGTREDVKSSKKESTQNENGFSTAKQTPNRNLLPIAGGVDTIKFFQNKIKERNEKMKQMRRLKVLRNSFNWKKNGARSSSINAKNSVKVEYSCNDSIEMEEVIVDHDNDATPSIVS